VNMRDVQRRRQGGQLQALGAIVLGYVFLRVVLHFAHGNMTAIVAFGLVYIAAFVAVMVLARLLHLEHLLGTLRDRIRMPRSRG